MPAQHRPTLFVWRDGEVHCALVVEIAPGTPPSGRRTELLCTAVTNNGEVWAATSYRAFGHPGVFGPSVAEGLREAMPDAEQPVGLEPYEAIRRAEPEYRLPVEWARRTSRKPGELHSTPAAATASARALPRSGREDFVSYVGYARYARRSAHSLDALHRTIDEAISHCTAVWGWECSGVEVKFHDAGASFGLAYAPGSGARSRVRKISLAVALIERYDLVSVRRVVVHELCHHYREEAWPRVASSPWYRPHDSKFCEQLALADPIVASDSRRCDEFHDHTDPSIVAEVARRKAVVPKRAPVWSPEAGVIVVAIRKGKGTFRIAWEPNREAGFRWRPEVDSVNDAAVLGMLKRFAPSDRKRVRVQCSPEEVPGAPSDLFALAVTLGGRYSHLMRETNAYLRDADTDGAP